MDSRFIKATTLIAVAKGPNQISIGTGFFYKHHIENESTIFLVTNKHVLENGQAIIQLSNSVLDCHESLVFGDNSEHWYGNPNENVDVAIFPIKLLDDLPVIERNDCMTLSEMRQEGIDYGYPIGMIGYPQNEESEMYKVMEASKDYSPIFRLGGIARMKEYGNENAMLADITAWHGNSGSPIVTLPDRIIGGKCKESKLIGIIAGFYPKHEEGRCVYDRKKNVYPVEGENMDIAEVFYFDNVLDTINEYFAMINGNHKS